MQNFFIEDFFQLPPVSLTLSCEYLREFLKNRIIRGLGELIHVEKLKSKISWNCPFKGTPLGCSVHICYHFLNGGKCERFAFHFEPKKTCVFLLFRMEAKLKKYEATRHEMR
jgi:hypothetical protein